MVLRADSQFHNADVVAACRRAGARFSLTVGMNPHVPAAVSAIAEEAWTAIRYPDAFVDSHRRAGLRRRGRYTAFTSRKKAEQVTARLIVRRVRRLNAEVAAGQGELFTAWRYHPVFTDCPSEMLQAGLQHRQHATIEQVIADGKSSALAHLPSGDFQANAAWLTLWAFAHNLLRAAGALARTFQAKATTVTLRAHLVHVPALIARTARKFTLHLPERWLWEHTFTNLFTVAHAPPTR